MCVYQGTEATEKSSWTMTTNFRSFTFPLFETCQEDIQTESWFCRGTVCIWKELSCLLPSLSPCTPQVLLSDTAPGSIAPYQQISGLVLHAVPMPLGSECHWHTKEVSLLLRGSPVPCSLPRGELEATGNRSSWQKRQFCQAVSKGIKQITTNKGNCLLNISHFQNSLWCCRMHTVVLGPVGC